MIVRNGQVEQIWSVSYRHNGFKYSIYVRGTESEMQDYMESEMGFVGSYFALSSKEIDAITTLQTTVYIAPKLSNIRE